MRPSGATHYFGRSRQIDDSTPLDVTEKLVGFTSSPGIRLRQEPAAGLHRRALSDGVPDLAECGFHGRERAHDIWIEMPAAFALDDFAALFVRMRGFVISLGPQGIVAIRHRHDAGGKGDIGAGADSGESERVSGGKPNRMAGDYGEVINYRQYARRLKSVAIVMKPLLFALCVVSATGILFAQKSGWQPSPGHTQMPIWPGAAPDAQFGPPPNTETTPEPGEVDNVSRPTMTVYSPKGKNTGAAVIVFPGGGYYVLAIDIEGTEACDWLTSKGITCVLLKYRVPNTGMHGDGHRQIKPKAPMALEDAQRTVGLVRFHRRSIASIRTGSAFLDSRQVAIRWQT
jgi:hypothetical protein